jgi:uncharacterized phiE125 gp8 family phage protein
LAIPNIRKQAQQPTSLPSSYKLEKQTESAQPAVSVCDLKAQVSLDDSSYDDLLEAFELAARDTVETLTGRVLTETTYTLYLDNFPDAEFYFPNGPVSSIESIEYLVDGVWTEADNAIYLMGRGRLHTQRIVKIVGQSWPSDKDNQPESVRINYTAGEVNNRGNQVIKLLVGHWFENREAVVSGSMSELPLAVQTLVRSLKTYAVR